MDVIFGAGGFAREVAWLHFDVHKSDRTRQIDAFVVGDTSNQVGLTINSVPVVAESTFFEENAATSVNVYIAVGSPSIRQRIHKACIGQLAKATYPPLVHPSVICDEREGAIALGDGCILCAGTILTTDIRVGNFVHINLGCTIGHDSRVGDYCTLSPGAHISGGVTLGDRVFIGTGAVILETLEVVADTSIGASATVVKSLLNPGTYVGTPASLLRK